MTRHLPAALLALSAFLPCDPAEAGRPLQTEDAGVLERGDCEVELVAARERSGHPTLSSGRGQLGCGVGLHSQVAVTLGRASGGDERADVFGFGGKTWLRQLTEEQTGIAIAWAAGYVRPRGSSTDREGVEVRAVVTHPIGPWLLHGNLGWNRDAIENRDSTVWGAAVERTGLGPIDAMFEFFGNDRDKPWANAGVRWNAIPGKVMIDGSYGRQAGSAGSTLATLGMKFAF